MDKGATPKNKPVNYEVYQVGDGTLRIVAATEATNDLTAIKIAMGENPNPGKYVAIPTRYLRVREVGVETVQKLVIA